MNRERLGRPRARMFVALDLAHSTRDALAVWQRELLALSPQDLRAMPPASLHVTLAFLGHRYLSEADPIAAAIQHSAAGAVPLAFEHELAPRPARHPRLYAAAAQQSPELMNLRAALVGRLEDLHVYKDEARPFWPHVTLCRVKSVVRNHRAIDHLPGAAPVLTQPQPAPRVTLYRSDLQPSGAVHTALSHVDLPDGPFRTAHGYRESRDATQER